MSAPQCCVEKTYVKVTLFSSKGLLLRSVAECIIEFEHSKVSLTSLWVGGFVYKVARIMISWLLYTVTLTMLY